MWQKYQPAIFTDDSKQELDREEMWVKVGRGRRGKRGNMRDLEADVTKKIKDDKQEVGGLKTG